MATKHFCDGCGRKIPGAVNHFSYKCHLDEPDVAGYSDAEGNASSGRSVGVMLCNKCYNLVLAPAVLVLAGLQLENQSKLQSE